MSGGTTFGGDNIHYYTVSVFYTLNGPASITLCSVPCIVKAVFVDNAGLSSFSTCTQQDLVSPARPFQKRKRVWYNSYTVAITVMLLGMWLCTSSQQTQDGGCFIATFYSIKPKGWS